MSSNTRIEKICPLNTPEDVLALLPNLHTRKIEEWRSTVSNILSGLDQRLLVIVGPCSVHDTKAALEYGQKLRHFSESVKDRLFIIMRVYFEKPRTTVGWKGHINDPFMDNTFQINHGIQSARKLLLQLNGIGLPCGGEFLDTISPQYLSDLFTWGAIGARTTESQVHRELVSGLSMPIGFKNGTGGSIKLAVSACISAKEPHTFLGVNEKGQASIVHTKGNSKTHIILRGGTDSPNYALKHIDYAKMLMNKQHLIPNVMVDCSHGNSQKNYFNQTKVAGYLSGFLKTEPQLIVGVMLESNLFEGKQDISSDMKYGVSVTDGCLSWKDTVHVLEYFHRSIEHIPPFAS